MPDTATPRRPVDVLDTQRAFAALCADLVREPRLALDVETTIYDQPQRLCVIQLATPTRNWVIDALALSDLSPIASLLTDERIQILIHNAGFEASVFAPHGITINNVYDTLTQSRRVRGTQPDGHSLKVVCQRELGLQLDKEMQRCDWTQRPLTHRHVSYAALDVEVLIDLQGIFGG